MILQNWWYTTLLGIPHPMCQALRKHIKADVLIIGGGMSGISAAAALMNTGRKIILLERNILGGSSTGKSAGFLTPDSELELSQIIRRYGKKGGQDLWEAPTRGIKSIVNNVHEHQIQCDLIKQDSLFVGLGKEGWNEAQKEVQARQMLGYDQTLYTKQQLPGYLGGVGYEGGIRYAGTYGINAMRYAQGMKSVLLENGVDIYESSEVYRLEEHKAITDLGSVTAETMVIAIDKIPRSLTPLADKVYHAQTFLCISEPLNDAQVTQMFPQGEMMCWDTKLVYNYYRLTGDRRVLLGGGSATTTFFRHAYNKDRVVKEIIKDFKKHFPFLSKLHFLQYWPGLIDTTQDLLPTLVRSRTAPFRHFILGCVGLPWAAFCGDFIARNILGTATADDQKFFRYFSPRRYFFMPPFLENIIGKPLFFSINNGWAKYFQIDLMRTLKPLPNEF